MKIYLNGAQKATYTNNSLNWTTNTNCGLQLGRYYVNSSYVFNGILDDLRIYKQAYTQAQVEQLYAEGLSEHQNLAKKWKAERHRVPYKLVRHSVPYKSNLGLT